MAENKNYEEKTILGKKVYRAIDKNGDEFYTTDESLVKKPDEIENGQHELNDDFLSNAAGGVVDQDGIYRGMNKETGKEFYTTSKSLATTLEGGDATTASSFTTPFDEKKAEEARRCNGAVYTN